MEGLWQSAEAREALLKDIVKFDSVTLSQGEKAFPYFIQQMLLELPYFKEHREQLVLAPTGDGRHTLMAHYTGQTSKKTIVLISHYDTVGIDDFGDYEQAAFDMEAITALFKEDDAYLNETAKDDLTSGGYLFGRGSMDMKPGLMLHLSLIEKAILEEWDINLMLMTVPDEEVNSLGMRTAMVKLSEIAAQQNLDIVLHLNSEPTFQQQASDNAHYVYSGSIGKLMPAVLCYGEETHVGTPMNGVSSNFMLNFINQSMEYNRKFKETFEDEATPLPVALMNKDIKDYYDVQTPFRSVALYNVFSFKQTAAEVFSQFNAIVREAKEKCEAAYHAIFEQEGVDRALDIKVLTYEELLITANEQLGHDKVEEIISGCTAEPALYLQNIHIVDELIKNCKAIGPAIITFFVPPYYPAVNASYEEDIEELVKRVGEKARREFNRKSKRLHYFNGISDLSYCLADSAGSGKIYADNTPTFRRTYHIPFDEIHSVQAPVLNCGPIGKDAHKVTERLNMKSAFEELPVLLETIIRYYLQQTEKHL
ncbi:M20/M25/M40 family metallo-hydrolase [Macrococcus carouselicus]|uniref:M20/M25/M40 family metallo-hydrolase n=1 Tax=Macrococcus carouselicus TaxID=69969 RepID=A0A9Q8CG45_9STAP|nr:M20/M25/M40 family metallo-hydrolase [Macrococcus carouselicus]TDM02264.1 M20/M25/M40 family metallo-hydrolase [Macrococcus carouselicus]